MSSFQRKAAGLNLTGYAGVILLLLSSCSAPQSSGGPPQQASFGWAAQDYQGDVWFTLSNGSTPEFDFRLGGGGSIAEMRNATTGYSEMLSPAYQAGVDTDRVIQSTFWVDNVLGSISAPDERFNLDLAGDSTGAFAQFLSLSHSNTATGIQVDVYSVNSLQWYPQLNSDFAGSDPAPSLTRYQLLADGTLKIRRVIRVPNVLLKGTAQPLAQIYFENWNPVGVGRNVDSMALSMDSSGNPVQWYSPSNFPYYQNWPMPTATSGYAVGFKNGAAQTEPVIGFVFGMQPAVVDGSAGASTGTTANDVLNSMLVTNDGIAILPATYVYNAIPGSIVDMEFRIVPRLTAGTEFAGTVTSQVSEVAAPAVYGPSYAFSGEMATIVATLNQDVSATGVQTEHLGAYW